MEQFNRVRPSLGSDWQLACLSTDLQAPVAHFFEITDLLLERVNLNSTHLFRADILLDTGGKLQTLPRKTSNVSSDCEPTTESPSIPCVPQGFKHDRTVVRKLIPRNPQLDRALEQTCLFYSAGNSDKDGKSSSELVVYVPHCTKAEEVPWYHPQIQALAYLYVHDQTASATLSVHYVSFRPALTTVSDRLQRTLNSLLATYVRLLRHPPRRTDASLNDHSTAQQSDDQSALKLSTSILELPLTPANLRDTILPQHLVQDRYAQLKTRYAKNLMQNWIEKTEPSKHVFEDLGIAAFLIELWRHMYNISDDTNNQEKRKKFPGFVDIACGNGVLTYTLLSEGWQGYGFDARRRQTWDVLHQLDRTLHLDQRLTEEVCMPRPFLDNLSPEDLDGLNFNDGVPPAETFIISNHADELTCWTPILAKMSHSPFLAIPCCSHALDGSRKRYSPRDIVRSQLDSKPCYSSGNLNSSPVTSHQAAEHDTEDGMENEQPATGDLLALRARRTKGPADEKSQYACLTRKTASLALELECSQTQIFPHGGSRDADSNSRSQSSDSDVELTLLRIPSTRNIGIIGGRRSRNRPALHEDQSNDSSILPSTLTRKLDRSNNNNATKESIRTSSDHNDSSITSSSNNTTTTSGNPSLITDKINQIIHRECIATNGVQLSAQTWLAKARKLQVGQGRGKVNWRSGGS